MTIDAPLSPAGAFCVGAFCAGACCANAATLVTTDAIKTTADTATGPGGFRSFIPFIDPPGFSPSFRSFLSIVQVRDRSFAECGPEPGFARSSVRKTRVAYGNNPASPVGSASMNRATKVNEGRQ
ncbi:MAG TPA: hypothetical protein VGN31_13280 [Paraburkholderia sp.]